MLTLMFLTPLTFITNTVFFSQDIGEEIIINSFEMPEDVAKIEPRNAQISLTDLNKLLVNFAHVDWPNIYFRIEQAFSDGDWRDFSALAVDVKNIEDEPVDLSIRVDDDFSADGSKHCRTGHAKLSPKQSVTLLMPLNDAIPEGMRAGPPILPDALTMRVGGDKIDWENIVAFQIYLPRPDRSRKLIVDNIRLLPSFDNSGIVDRYGQFTRADWKGKVHEDKDLHSQFSQEQDWLKSNSFAEHDEFGGWKNGPQLRATGFFRTAYTMGRWWLVTPTGRLFFSIGIDCIRENVATPVKNREHLFTWLPEKNEAKSAAGSLIEFSRPGSNRWANFYGMNLLRKYGENWKKQWLNITAERLLAWGFNTIGNWSTAEIFRLRRVPYTMPIHYGWGDLPHFPTSWRHMPDVFDEQFPQVVDDAIASKVKEWKDDQWCIGYFVDNELSWGGWGSDAKARYDVPIKILESDNNLPSKYEFARLLQVKYGTIDLFNTAWQVQLKSWEEFTAKPVQLPEEMTPACIADLSNLLTHFAQRYFKVVSSALKKHAPNQLYLGCRFAPRPMEVVKVSAKFCDVVSFNIYKKRVDHKEWSFTNTLGKPCMIGEFHFGALDRGMFHGGLVPVTDQHERGKAYQEYVQSVWGLPAFVGCHWFQYIDQPITGRFDGENYNIGFVSIVDYPHWEIVEAARQINFQVYEQLSED